MEHVRYLSESIGVRVAGTSGEYEAAAYIEECFRKLGLATERQEFSFLNWLPLEKPRLFLTAPECREIAVAPMGYTLPSPSDGVEGELKKIGKMYLIPGYMEWEKYVLVNEGREVAFLLKNPNGAAAPFPTGIPLLPEVGGVIGREDAALLDALLDKGPVRLRLFNLCWQGAAQSQNIIGMLGAGSPRLIVTAHYDSAFYAPGAVDNASGIQALMKTAEAFLGASEPLPAPVAFVAMGCEEPGLLGARHYVKHLKEHGALEDIRFCVNYDMIGRGERIVLRAGKGMEAYTADLKKKFEGSGRYEIALDTAKASSDNWPFEEQGIANMQFVSLPFPVYHRKEDTIEQCDQALCKQVEEMGIDLIHTLLRGL